MTKKNRRLLLVGGLALVARGCKDKPPDGPPPAEKSDFASFSALQECTWEIRIIWHHQNGYGVRAKYDTPNHPMGSQTTMTDGPDLKLALDAALQQVKADDGHR